MFPCLMTVIRKRDELGFSFPTSHAGSSDSESTTAISFSASLAKPSIEILLHQAEEHWLRESLIKEQTGCRWAPLLPATLSSGCSQNQWGQGTVKNGPAVIKSDRGEKRERWKRGGRPKHFWMSARKYLTAKHVMEFSHAWFFFFQFQISELHPKIHCTAGL